MNASPMRWLKRSADKIRLPDYAGWRIPRHNYIFGVLTKGAGWFPDYQTRLLRVGQGLL